MSKKVFGCRHLLCLWHVKQAWLNNIYKKTSSKEVGNDMFSKLDKIMLKCNDDEYLRAIVSKFNIDFHEEKDALKYLKDNWFDGDRICKFIHNICMLIIFLPFKDFMILILVFFCRYVDEML